MKISELSPQDESSFNELAAKYGTIFNTTYWTKIFGNNVQRYGIYYKSGVLIGGFIICKKKKVGLSIYQNPPFTPTIGPFLKVDAQNPVNVMDRWKKTLSLISNFLDSLPYTIISVSLNHNIIDTQPFIWDKFKVIPHYTYVVDLRQSVSDIEGNLSKSHRHAINRAIKDGLVVKQINDMSIVKRLVLKSYSRQGEKVDEFYLDKILFNFSTQENSYAFATFKNNIPISTTFIVYDKVVGYALIGGYDHNNKHNGAGILTRIEAIKHAKKKGLQYFDFEGSMVPGIEKFYRGFGGQLTSYYRINKAKLPIEMLLKLFKRELF